MKYMALDIGEKRIGIAVTDESGIVVRPLCSLEAGSRFMEELGQVIETETVKKVILGIPRHETGEEAKSAEGIRQLAKTIHFEFNIEVDFEDESGTSLEAEKRLKERGLGVSEIKKEVDAEAAAVILEGYLARK